MIVLCNKEYREQNCKDKDCKDCKYCHHLIHDKYICMGNYPVVNDKPFELK